MSRLLSLHLACCDAKSPYNHCSFVEQLSEHDHVHLCLISNLTSQFSRRPLSSLSTNSFSSKSISQWHPP